MMKFFLTSVSCVLLGVILAESVVACSIYIPPLRRDFRKAESVFIGRVVSVNAANLTLREKEELSDFGDSRSFSRMRFQVLKKWKGARNKELEFSGIAHDFCGCPGGPMDQFVEGKEYLIFARRKTTLSVCESEPVTNEKIARLDSFWFRTWARIYPF